MFCPTSSCSIDGMYNLCYMMYLSKLSSPNFKIISQLLYYNFLRISLSTSHTPPGYLWHCCILVVDCCMTWYVLSYFFLFYRWHVQSCYMMYLSKLYRHPILKKSHNCYIIIFSEYHRQPDIHLLAICGTVVLYSTWLIVAWVYKAGIISY